MVFYCCFGSPSTEFNDVNLQLFSLKKAAENWNELVYWINTKGTVNQQKERLVFILNCLGLSLTQLLGQSNPYLGEEDIPSPYKLLISIMKYNKNDRVKRREMAIKFKEFLIYYNSIRHFGKNKNENKYKIIDQLTLEKLDQFRKLTIDIWDEVCGLKDQAGVNRSVDEVIIFNNLIDA